MTSSPPLPLPSHDPVHPFAGGADSVAIPPMDGVVALAPAPCPIGPGEAFDRYLVHLRYERQAAKSTLDQYRAILRELARYLDDHRPGSTVADLGLPVFRAYLRNACGTGRINKIALRVYVLRAVFAWLYRRGIIATNPATLLLAPRVPRTLPMFLNPAEAKAVVEAADETSAEGLRDRAMLEVFYGAGLRVSELHALDVGDVGSQRSDGLGTVRVLGKGNKERIVPLGSYACRALDRYLLRRGHLRHPKTRELDPDALFVSTRGRRLGKAAMRQLVHHYGDVGATRPDLHPHALRHTFATHLIEGGADLRSVQKMMGHETVSTTQRYLQVTMDGLVKVYQRAHPLARRK